MTAGERIKRLYDTLLAKNGNLNWWPGDTAFEVICGAILTQSCAWRNVEKAIENLKAAALLDAKSMYEANMEDLETAVRPSGYYKQKAKKLKAFLEYFKTFDFSIERLKKEPKEKLREELLGVWGIGKETADSILCYALEKKVFVVDAYTRRIFSRMDIIGGKEEYDEIALLIRDSIKCDIELYKDYHAQIVFLGKDYCRKKAQCGECPAALAGLCSYSFDA